MSAPSSQTTIVAAADVVNAMTAGGSFLETSDYRVGMARREGPGDAEVHDIDTDVFYVFEGTATLVSGGLMVEPRTVNPNEHRAARTTGGEARPVRKGDVIVIPRGVPHWFNAVSEAPFVYLVVKSTAR